ncbi:hypothetical protein O181_008562 [Austropuccinia psidii MF-1]|uniref:Uncharacterized protein n=1 Tax=Austropuccinia psidii MF-1 TaxID=1389203 RepID=A0A9Q3BP13_9BASI|nr:hypothetical protein [Austropuccinia psidii MF-1]
MRASKLPLDCSFLDFSTDNFPDTSPTSSSEDEPIDNRLFQVPPFSKHKSNKERKLYYTTESTNREEFQNPGQSTNGLALVDIGLEFNPSSVWLALEQTSHSRADTSRRAASSSRPCSMRDWRSNTGLLSSPKSDSFGMARTRPVTSQHHKLPKLSASLGKSSADSQKRKSLNAVASYKLENESRLSSNYGTVASTSLRPPPLNLRVPNLRTLSANIGTCEFHFPQTPTSPRSPRILDKRARNKRD